MVSGNNRQRELKGILESWKTWDYSEILPRQAHVARKRSSEYRTRWWFETFFVFTKIPGKIIRFDEKHIFQMGGKKPPTILGGWAPRTWICVPMVIVFVPWGSSNLGPLPNWLIHLWLYLYMAYTWGWSDLQWPSILYRIDTWIFQICKVCAEIHSKKLPKGRIFYISRRSRYRFIHGGDPITTYVRRKRAHPPSRGEGF